MFQFHILPLLLRHDGGDGDVHDARVLHGHVLLRAHDVHVLHARDVRALNVRDVHGLHGQILHYRHFLILLSILQN